MKKYILAAWIFLLVLPVFSQRSKVVVYSTSDDSIACGANLSAYRTFFRLELYSDAYQTWIVAFENCPSSSEKMYVDGVTMYRSFIESAPDELNREGLIDTLMLIYDRRMEYFGGEGNILGRKGIDLLTFRGDDILEAQKAYAMLQKSIELEGVKSRQAVILNFIASGVRLNKDGLIDENQIIEDYIMVVGILDQLEEKSSRWERTMATVDEIMHKEGILSCESLDRYYEPHFKEYTDSKTFLEAVITAYDKAGCEGSDYYLAASENLYKVHPGPESARNLAMLFITRNNFQKAAEYLKEAVQGEGIDKETKAQWYYELAVVSNANAKYCEAIDYAGEAIANKSDFGKAYIILGDAIIASRTMLGEDIKQRMAFWVAADQYSKAAAVDPALQEAARQKISDITAQFPDREELFFLDMKDGDSYLVEGCINKNTTVRSGS